MRILRLLSSRPLSCGCLAGIYETYAGPIAWIIDARGVRCADTEHQPGGRLDSRGSREGAPVLSRAPARVNH
jgi:hypothetical protein